MKREQPGVILERSLVLPHAVAEWARSDPGRLALQDVGGRSYTYREFHESNLKWAKAYRRLGIGGADNVLTMLPNVSESYCSWLGLAWLRAVEVPLNTDYRGRILAYVMEQSQARVMVVAARYLDRIAGLKGKLAQIETLVVPDGSDDLPSLSAEVVTGNRLFGDSGTVQDIQGPDYHDIALMVYTSGTTGPSKGVLIPWAELYAWSSCLPSDAMDPEGAYYRCQPQFHVGGRGALYTAAVPGARLVTRERCSVTSFWDDIREYGCTLAALPGPLASMVYRQPERADDADNPLTTIYMGPVIPEVEEFKRRFGVRVATGYGMTEIGVPIVTKGWELRDWKSCGRVRNDPYPGYEIRIVNEYDEPVATGEVGELIIRADAPWVLNAGYYRMPEKTAEAWRNGWFHTGDAFKSDGEGNLYFVDRLKDCIRRRGQNISSLEVESEVLQHPAVVECAALGIPSELGEEDVKVAVVIAEGSDLSPEELIEFLIPRMPRFMIPRYVELVDALPKTEATKRTRKVDLRGRPSNENTWDREAVGIVIPR